MPKGRAVVPTSTLVAPADLNGAAKKRQRRKTLTAPTRLRLQKYTTKQVVHVVHRIAALGAVFYVYTCLHASIHASKMFQGMYIPFTSFNAYQAHLIQYYMGTGRLQDSVFVQTVLNNDLTPRTHTVYLHSNTDASNSVCSAAKFNDRIYSDDYVRQFHAIVTKQVGYAVPFLESHQLIASIVDCSFTGLQVGDDSVMRVYYLMQHKTNPDAMLLTCFSVSPYDCQATNVHRLQTNGVVMILVTNDLQVNSNVTYYTVGSDVFPFAPPYFVGSTIGAITKEGWRIGYTKPKFTNTNVLEIWRASRWGYFLGSEHKQSNVNNRVIAKFPNDPHRAMSEWSWVGTTVIRDQWIWVAFIYIIFAADMIFNLFVLAIISARNVRKRKIWIGDAFVSVSSSVILRGVLTLIMWVLDRFWGLFTFIMQDATIIGNTLRINSSIEILHMDLFSIYLSLVGLVGVVLQERIDPVVAGVVFEVTFQNRVAILRWFPSIASYLALYAQESYLDGVKPTKKEFRMASPIRYRTIHDIKSVNPRFVAAGLMPFVLSFIVILIYAMGRKIYHHYNPDANRILPASSHVSTNLSSKMSSTASSKDSNHGDDDEIVETKPIISPTAASLTIFESATGAALQNRVGLIADYEKYVIIKSMRFASADGIYSNGFVIIDSKFLARAADLPSILFIIVTRWRFRNIRVYEVHGHVVQDTAYLLYPNMLQARELWSLDIAILK